MSDDVQAYVQAFDSAFLSAKSFSTTLEKVVQMEMAVALYEAMDFGGSYKPYAEMKSILNHDSESEDWTVSQMIQQSA